MPAPQSSAILAGLMSRLPGKFKADHGPLNQFGQQLCRDIATAWAAWQQGLLAGGNNVSGGGSGVWTGTGSGGGLQQTQPFTIVHGWPHQDPDGYWNTFNAAITADFKEKFGRYVSTYTFASVPYVGTSPPPPPAPFTATSTPGTLGSYKASAKVPDDLASGIRSKLPGGWGNNPDPLDGFLGALADAVKEQFDIWESTSKMMGNTVSGGPSGTGTSAMDGKVT